MFKRIVYLLFFVTLFGCGGRQGGPTQIETRPMEKGKAISIIEEMLAERGYSWDKEAPVQVAGSGEFACDFRIKNEKIAIEYLTAEDRARIGEIPPPAKGSRLHVINGRVVSPDGVPSRVFVFFIDDRKFVYHSNPNSEVRADVTYPEVDTRLRRDIADFLSWYENSGKR
jgi:hypothetical protein